MPTPTSIAFVGLGAMGAPMAENLVRKQFRVTGFDMREAAREALVAAFEASYVDRVLAKHSGNVTRAAEAAGVARRYMHLLKARVRP